MSGPKDLLGRTIMIGDTVVHATRQGDVAELNVKKVLKINGDKVYVRDPNKDKGGWVWHLDRLCVVS